MTSKATAPITIETQDSVSVLTLNRPESRNAAGEEMKSAVLSALEQVAGDVETRALVITGRGAAFSAGGDVSNFARIASDGDYRRRDRLRQGRRIVDTLIDFPVPVVVAVNGPAVGFGSTLASLGDIVLASENAYFSDPHVSIGLVAGDGGVVSWPLVMSLLKAKEYILLGERIPAADALRLGLVNRVVEPDRLMNEALDVGRRLARQPRLAVQETKKALNLHLRRAALGILDMAAAAQSESFTSEEHREWLASLD